MAGDQNKIAAPKINAHALWQLDSNQFNTWRQEHDYPRIVLFFQNKLQDFSAWMKDQGVSQDMLVKHSPSAFLKNQNWIYLYSVINIEQNVEEILSETKYAIGSTFFHQNKVQTRKDIKPYPIWFFQKNKKKAPEPTVNSKIGRSHFIMNELELLDLGNCHLAQMFILSSRKLDFVNISDLTIKNCLNNSLIDISFSTASNLTIEGDLHFINAYKSTFYELFSLKFQNLKLLNGNYQSWSFMDCRVNLSATNANLNMWTFVGYDFSATISNVDISNSKFRHNLVRYPIDCGRYRDFHSHIKRLYSQIGKKKEASRHFYWEKTFERKSFWQPKPNYQERFFKAKSKTTKRLLGILFFIKWIYSFFLNCL